MNERIKELMTEARLPFSKTGSYFTQELLMGKFAELIVRDCAEFVQFYYKDHMCEVIAHDMKQHFGVRE
jgi:hypothetical protein